LLEEPGDLTREERLRILVTERDFAKQNHWQRLGLNGNPQRADVKKAFRELSKRFHPDRYFGRDTGSFADKLHSIFQQLKEANDTLHNDEKRAAYRKKVSPPPAPKRTTPAPDRAPKEETEQEKKERLQRLEERRAQIMSERKSRTKRMRMKKIKDTDKGPAKAASLYQAALIHIGKLEYQEAFLSLKLAVEYAPKDQEIKERFEEVSQQVNLERASSIADDALTEGSDGRHQRAAELYLEAWELAPSKTQHVVQAAFQFAKAGLNKKAEKWAKQAAEDASGRRAIHIAVAEVFEMIGNTDAARSHAERAGTLDPTDGRVKKFLRRLGQP
jgi:curved DNA-binding protein CbpA